jgi:hypothetical protein
MGVGMIAYAYLSDATLPKRQALPKITLRGAFSNEACMHAVSENIDEKFHRELDV